MQDSKKQSNATLGIILVVVGVILLMMYLASNNNAGMGQPEEPAAGIPAQDTAPAQEEAADAMPEESAAPAATPARGPADPAVIKSTLSELEQDLGESYDDSNVDASFQDQTGDLTDAYAF